MGNFGEKLEIVKLNKLDNMAIKHKVNNDVFFSSCISMTTFVVFIFVLYNVLLLLKVVNI